MTSDEQRIALDRLMRPEWSGIEIIFADTWPSEEVNDLVYLFDFKIKPRRVPQYTTDLNVVHEAYRRLIRPKPELALGFYRELCEIVARNKDGSYKFGVVLYDEVTNASAAERCEAILKALKVWKTSI